MSAPPIPLSVLDLAPVVAGSTPAEALRRSIEVAVVAERLGYRRFWVAEHHNMAGVASSAPAVLLAHAACATTTIRIGSGGVMLPNHAPLAIAEQFGMLEALHPGRVDLGIGRAPGTDHLTAGALRRRARGATAEELPSQLAELLAYFDGTFPEGHPYAAITPVPARGYRPAVWLLGSSRYGAVVAGTLGLPYCFAHHFSPAETDGAVAAYRSSFTPSPDLAAPELMVAVAVVCAPTDEEAEHLAGPSRLNALRIRTGRRGPLPTPEEAAAYPWTPEERAAVAGFTAGHLVGSPATVRDGLLALAGRTGACELIVTTSAHDQAHRLRSFTLVAEAMQLTSPATGSR
jgi:luciferase family oxidoreductase group 1